MSTEINFQISCVDKEYCLVQYSTSSNSEDEERRDSLLALLLLAFRQASNLKGKPEASFIGGALSQIAEEGLDFFPENLRDKLSSLGGSAKKQFIGSVSFDGSRNHLNFQMDVKGFGLFSKDVGSYAIRSTLFLVFHFLDKYKNTDFEVTIKKALELSGAFIFMDEVTLTNQNNLVATIMNELDMPL